MANLAIDPTPIPDRAGHYALNVRTRNPDLFVTPVDINDFLIVVALWLGERGVRVFSESGYYAEAAMTEDEVFELKVRWG